MTNVVGVFASVSCTEGKEETKIVSFLFFFWSVSFFCCWGRGEGDFDKVFRSVKSGTTYSLPRPWEGRPFEVTFPSPWKGQHRKVNYYCDSAFPVFENPPPRRRNGFNTELSANLKVELERTNQEAPLAS